MKLARRALTDPNRLTDLQREMEARLDELIAEATDAGYSSDEALMVLKVAVAREEKVVAEDPDPADDPS